MKRISAIVLGMIIIVLVFSRNPKADVNDSIIANKQLNDDSNATLKTSEWNSGFNYSIIDNYPYSWIEINETGNNITDTFHSNGNPDWDDGYTGISFSGQGWTFTFYGTEYDTINVTTNGYLSFSGQGDLDLWDSNPIPQDCTIGSYNHHNDTVFLFHTDINLDPSDGWGGGSVLYEFKGSAPNRYLVIEYFQVNNYSEDGVPHLVGDFEVIFYENGDIKFQYKLVRDLFWYSSCLPVAGLDHGDLINYSNYTNDWNKTFNSAPVQELAVYFRLSKTGVIFLPSVDDDDDDDDEEAVVPGFDLYFILLSALVGLVIIAKKLKKNKN